MMKPLNIVHQAGLTLLEVLIALLVLAIGMAGLGALLLTALTNVHSASHYSLASAIALDFEERLWFEIASISDQNSDDLAQGCLTSAQIEAVREELIDRWTLQGSLDWTTAGARRLELPDLSVTVAEPQMTEIDNADAEPSGLRWQRLDPITITWRESRFALDGAQEQVEFGVVIVCRPTF